MGLKHAKKAGLAAGLDLGCGVKEECWTTRALRQTQVGPLRLRASLILGKLPATVVAASCGILGPTHLSSLKLFPLALQTSFSVE